MVSPPEQTAAQSFQFFGPGPGSPGMPWCLSPPFVPCLIKQPILWSRQQNPFSPSSQDHHVITTSPWGSGNILLCGLTLCNLSHLIIRGILLKVKSDQVSLKTLQRLPASQGMPTSLRWPAERSYSISDLMAKYSTRATQPLAGP